MAVLPTPALLGVKAYQGLIDAADDALLAVDAAGTVRLANLAAAALLGVERDRLVGTPSESWLPGALPAALTEAEEPPEPTHAVGRRADGQELSLELTLRPLSTPGGTLTCVVLRDLSRRDAVARACDRLREELIASVSHELRTPLTSIMGYTEILVDLGEPLVSQEARRILAIVRRNADRQLAVVEDLLTLSVLGGAGVNVNPVPTDLGRVLRAVLADLGSLAEEAGVTVVPSGLSSLRVLGDPDRLAELVGSLVRQAVKLSRHGDEVTVRLTAEPGHGLLEVGDRGGALGGDGAGIGGLGGPLLRGIVEAHAGQLGVDHQPGAGTTVRVRLPTAG